VGEGLGGWRRLHKEELCNLYASPNKRMIRSRWASWTGDVARLEEIGNVYNILVVKPEGKRQLGRPRRGWEDNIRMDLRKMG
jgi:hypothetical protein